MIVLFFVLAFAITWGLQMPALLAKIGGGSPERYMALVGLGAFGPMFAAMITARIEGSGIRALFARLRIVRVGSFWYVLALVFPGALFVLAAFVFNAFGHSEPLVYPPAAPAYVLAAIVFPFGEEIGWRGFALPRLLARTSPFASSAIVGVLWALWHIPMLMLQNVDLAMFAVFLPYMIAGSVFFTWLFRRTNGSLLLAVLAHVGVHLNNPGHAMPDRYTPIEIHTVAWSIVAVLLLLDRRAFKAS